MCSFPPPLHLSQLRKSDVIKKEREKALKEMGIALNDKGNTLGVFSPQKQPHLLNLSDDPQMCELLVYYIQPGRTRVGSASHEQGVVGEEEEREKEEDEEEDGAEEGGKEIEEAQDIVLTGEGIADEHCFFQFEDGVVTFVWVGGGGVVVVVSISGLGSHMAISDCIRWREPRLT